MSHSDSYEEKDLVDNHVEMSIHADHPPGHLQMEDYDNTRPMNVVGSEPWTNRMRRSCGSLFVCCNHFNVQDYQHMTISEFGRFKGAVGPGTFSYNCCTDDIKSTSDTEVKDYHHGVLTRDGRFVRVLPPGLYFINDLIGEKLQVVKDSIVPDYSHGVLTRDGRFVKVLPPGIYFANPALSERITIVKDVEVPENHFGIKTRDGVFVPPLLKPGMYFANTALGEAILATPETIVQEGHQGILLRDGKFVKVVGSGRIFVNPVLKEEIVPVDVRVLTKELVPLTIVTKDTTSFTIHGILVYQIVDPKKAICEVDTIDHAIREQIKSISQQVLSEHDLDYIMVNKLKLSSEIRDRVKRNCESWGIVVHAIDIKELVLPKELQKEMTAAATAKRAAEAMIIKSEAEVKNAESMKQVAGMLDSKAATHMREIDALKEICRNPNVKILFVAPGLHGLMDERSLGRIIQEGAKDM